jgi:16S rRNA (guanine527-N7)-methyltransferase
MPQDLFEMPINLKEKFHVIYKLHQESVHNLTSITDENEFYLKHVVDSIYIFKIRDINFKTALDVGSGGGFPGIALGLIYPERKIYLVESIAKKCNFLEALVKSLGLTNIHIINARVENLQNPKCDLITSRGVTKVKNLIKWTENVSREATIMLLYKGENIHDELKQASKLLKKKHMEYENVRIEKPIKRTYTFIYRT